MLTLQRRPPSRRLGSAPGQSAEAQRRDGEVLERLSVEKVETSPRSHGALDPSGVLQNQQNLRGRSRTDPARHRPDVGLNRPQERCCVFQGADEHSGNYRTRKHPEAAP